MATLDRLHGIRVSIINGYVDGHLTYMEASRMIDAIWDRIEEHEEMLASPATDIYSYIG